MRYKISLPVACTVFLLLCAMPAFAISDNIAVGKKVYATSSYSDSHCAELAIDNLVGTQWTSKCQNQEDATKVYFQLDLGAYYNITSVKLVLRGNGYEYERQYFRVLMSGSEDFHSCIEIHYQGETACENYLNIPVTRKNCVRYIRFEKLPNAEGNMVNATIREMRVYASSDPPAENFLRTAGKNGLSSDGKRIAAYNEEILYTWQSDNFTEEPNKEGMDVKQLLLTDCGDLLLAPNGTVTKKTECESSILFAGGIDSVSGKNGGFAAVGADGRLWIWGEAFGFAEPVLMPQEHILFADVSHRIAAAVDRNGSTFIRKEDGTWHSVLTGIRVKKAVCGDAHWIFLTEEGKVYGMGSGIFGELGNGFREYSEEPAAMCDVSDVTDIYAAGRSTYFIKSDGSVWVCGLNHYKSSRKAHFPVQISEIQNAVRLSANYDNAVVLDEYGMLYIIGSVNDETEYLLPKPVGMTNTAVVSYEFFTNKDGYGYISDGNGDYVSLRLKKSADDEFTVILTETVDNVLRSVQAVHAQKGSEEVVAGISKSNGGRVKAYLWDAQMRPITKILTPEEDLGEMNK